MNGAAASPFINNFPSSCSTVTTATTIFKRKHNHKTEAFNGVKGDHGGGRMGKKALYFQASFLKWTIADVVHVATHHWIPCLFALGLLFFMAVEYTLRMVPSSSPPFDLGFIATRSLHRVLQSWPELNTVLAGLNTVCRLIFISASVSDLNEKAIVTAFFEQTTISTQFMESKLISLLHAAKCD